ncbi:hypothetical protein J2780_001045 [Chryseobacterium camelliae]|nr:hypothetical protein [Chryseobacterium camelliae]
MKEKNIEKSLQATTFYNAMRIYFVKDFTSFWPF